MKAEEKDKLRGLFQEVELDKPSAAFESRLMEHIHIAAAKQTKKRNIRSIFAIAGGIMGMLGIPAFIFWKLGLIFEPELKPVEIDLTFTMPEIKIDPLIISIAFVVLLLLISDTLIRRRIWEKKQKD
ncbi:hypothetical protein [Dysgonomonas termitidis]|uniref:DUF5056 domain-containing protein n=1 Tax=Dysgonomonas termitidis TaxID=1516126 RepID=A0ABV9KWW3_9BACT